jgi:ribonuclease HI
MVYYSVPIGRTPGIYDKWDEVTKNVNGYPGCKFKKFKELKDAEEYYDKNKGSVSINAMTQKNNNVKQYFLNLDRTTDKDNSLRDTCVLISKTHLFSEKDLKKNVKTNGETNDETSNYSFKDAFTIDVFTDGSCINNGKGKLVKGGYGIYFPTKHEYNIANPFFIHPVTNNRAELFALIHLFNIMPNVTGDFGQTFNIHTDSKYSITIHKRIMKMISKYSLKDIMELLNKYKKHKYFNYIERKSTKSEYHISHHLIDVQKTYDYIFPELDNLINLDLVLEFVCVLKRNKFKYVLNHVRAHQANDNYFSIQNNKVDKLAKKGTTCQIFHIIE